MPAVPVSPLTPVWERVAALLPEPPAVVPTHPPGRHRRRAPDRLDVDLAVAAPVHGSDDERIPGPGCAAGLVAARMLIEAARDRFRWPARPATRRPR